MKAFLIISCLFICVIQTNIECLAEDTKSVVSKQSFALKNNSPGPNDSPDPNIYLINTTIRIFGFLMSFLMTLFGAIVAVGQFRNKKELENRINELKESIDIEKKVKSFQDEMKSNMKEEIEGIDGKVQDKVESLFKKKYHKEIFANTKAFAEEALMMTPPARGLLLARLSNMDEAIKNLLNEFLGEEKSKQLHNIIGDMVEDWHTLGQLFSIDKEQLETGLLSIQAHPFPEIYTHLKVLRTRYSDDGELYPMINEAIKAVEKTLEKET